MYYFWIISIQWHHTDRVQKTKKATNYCARFWSLVMVRATSCQSARRLKWIIVRSFCISLNYSVWTMLFTARKSTRWHRTLGGSFDICARNSPETIGNTTEQNHSFSIFPSLFSNGWTRLKTCDKTAFDKWLLSWYTGCQRGRPATHTAW